LSNGRHNLPGMRFIPPGNVGFLLPLGGSFTRNADGSVDTTDPVTIMALLSSGWGSPGELSGAGSPEGVVAAPVGSEYRQTDGTAQTAFWFKATGTGSTGWIPFGPVQIYSATKTLSADGTGADGAIVGSGAGSVGHSAGVALVPAVAGKVICPIGIKVAMTFATAAYTGGGNVTASWSGTVEATTAISAANSFNLAASGVAYATKVDVTSNAASGVPLALKAASAFTQPGTAAGTAIVTCSYVLL